MIYLDFLLYYLKSGNDHSIHSPFVFDLYNEVIKNRKIDPIFFDLEKERNNLLRSKNIIEVEDYGAGSKLNPARFRKVSQIAKFSLKSEKWARFLFYLIKKYNYSKILDLGTSLGITTAYMAQANPNAELITFDGCHHCLNIAKEIFQKQNITNIEIVEGNLDFTLKTHIDSLSNIDLVFFDANHQYFSTLNYFNLCLLKSKTGTCFVFDDIYWSEGMKNAWKEIIKNPKVTFSIDLFYIGVVFIEMKAAKQHFVLR